MVFCWRLIWGLRQRVRERQEVSKGSDSAPKESLLSSVFFFFLVARCGILVPQRLNLCPHQGQLRLLTTRPPRNSPLMSYVIKEDNAAAAAAAASAAAKLLQLCPTLCNPIDGSLPGSPVPGILQARTLEWVAISFSNA